MKCLTFFKVQVLLFGSLTLVSTGKIALCQTSEEFQRQAEELARSYHFIEAIQLLEMGLQSHPQSEKLKQQLGTLLVQTGRANEGAQLLEGIQAKRPHQPEILSQLAEARIRESKFSAAVSLLMDAIWHRPQDGQLRNQLAQALLREGHYQQALQEARRSVELDPLHAGYRRLYSLLLDVTGYHNEAYDELKMVHRLSPEDTSILFQLGEKERMAGRLEEAQQSLQLASRLDPENPLYHSALAQLLEQLGETGRSREEAEKSRDLSRAFDTYVEALQLTEAKDLDRAVAILRPVVDRHPEFLTGALFLAGLLSRTGNQQQALQLYTKILEANPSQRSARSEASWILTQKGEYSKALETLGKESHEDANGQLIVGYEREQLADYGEAIKSLRRVLNQNPLNSDLLLWIAHCLQRSGRREEALEMLAGTEGLRRDNPALEVRARQIRWEIAREKAFQLFEASQWKNALMAFSNLKEMPGHDDDAEIQLHIAYCRQQLHDLTRAAQDYRMGLELEPRASWARKNLAGILYQLGHFRDAIDQWKQLPTESQDSGVLYQLGLCQAYLGRFDEAESSFQSAMDHGHPTPELLYNLGVIRLRRMGAGAEGWDFVRRSAAANYGPAQNLLKRAGFVR